MDFFVLFQRSFKKLRTLPQKSIIPLAQMTNYDEFYGQILRPLMKVRVPGTKAHAEVRKVKNILT